MTEDEQHLVDYLDSLSPIGKAEVMKSLRTCLLYTGGSTAMPLMPKMLDALKRIREVLWAELGVEFEEYT